MVKLRKFPTFGFQKEMYYKFFKGIKMVYILNYVPFVKDEAMELLRNELDWKYYGGKHYESVFTRFFHANYLPERFGFDLRKAYLSALVCSGQISRSDALDELKSPPASDEVLRRDREYVFKKLGLAENEYRAIMAEQTKTYRDYPNNDYLWLRFSGLVKWARSRVTRVK
jgi:hypothetical protein